MAGQGKAVERQWQVKERRWKGSGRSRKGSGKAWQVKESHRTDIARPAPPHPTVMIASGSGSFALKEQDDQEERSDGRRGEERGAHPGSTMCILNLLLSGDSGGLLCRA